MSGIPRATPIAPRFPVSAAARAAARKPAARIFG
jgi:hypothetical protein